VILTALGIIINFDSISFIPTQDIYNIKNPFGKFVQEFTKNAHNSLNLIQKTGLAVLKSLVTKPLSNDAINLK
jgi:hypothetical protein